MDRWRIFIRKVKLFAAKGPKYHYTYGRWRLNRCLGLGLSKMATWDDRSFFKHLDLDQPGLAAVRAATREANDEQAKVAIRTYFLDRRSPRFFFDEDDLASTLARIPQVQKQFTIEAANDVCNRRFSFRQSEPFTFEKRIDWAYQPRDNVDWMWDLNRHVFFETLGRAYRYTGDERYAAAFSTLLMDWLSQNPVKSAGPNWSSVFEVGFRINTWIWAFHMFRSAAIFDPDLCVTLLKGLCIHGHYLDAMVELHAQNNHLLLEAKSLALLGLLFPEFKRAQRWRRRGLDIVYQQVRDQVCSDGVHGERTTLYHRVIAGELLELLVLMAHNALLVPSDILQTVERMVEFECWVTKPDGTVPLLSDSALEDTYLRVSARRGGPLFFHRPDLNSPEFPPGEAEIWRLGAGRMIASSDMSERPAQLHSRAFPEGGYVVMRQGHTAEAPYLVFDCGPFGYKPVPSHGHADALSLELYAHQQTLLVDPGVYSTHLGTDWRNYFRGTRAHNTVVVDGLDQSELLEVWRVDRQAQTTLHSWITSPHFDFVDASHDGYERLRDPITHRRQIFFAKPDYWIVIDGLSGQGEHCFDWYYHFMPDVDVDLHQPSYEVRARGSQAALAVIPLSTDHALQAEIMTGSTEPLQGWVSVLSGEKCPAPTLRYRRNACAPQRFCTVLFPHDAQAHPTVRVSPLDITMLPGATVDPTRLVGLKIETDFYTDYLVIDQTRQSATKKFLDYQANGWLVYLRHWQERGQLRKVVIRGDLHFVTAGESVIEKHQSNPYFIYDGKRHS
jgi:hypothetical protein